MPRKPRKEPDYDKPFEFPNKLCDQLDECSPNGFCLFFINAQGDVDIRLNYAHGMAEGAIRDFGARFFNSISESMSIQETQNFLMDSMPPPEDLGEEED